MSKQVIEHNSGIEDITGENDAEYFKIFRKVYDTVMKLIINQVYVNCKERGEVLDQVWKAYLKDFEKILKWTDDHK